MTQAVPTVAEINDNLIAQLQTELNQTIPLLPRSFLRVLAKAVAAVFILVYKYAGFTGLQQFVRTASDQPTDFNGTTVTPIIEWGRLIGVGDPVEATRAELNLTATVTAAGTIPGNTQLLGQTNSVLYLTVAAQDVTVGQVTVLVRASSDPQGGNGSGTIGNLDAGARVSFVPSFGFVETDTVVASQMVTGANAELTEVYRQRVIQRFQRRPQGGALVDYQIWGEEVAGVVNVYPYTGSPGTVVVYVEAGNQPNGIPTQAQLDAVEMSINLDMNGRATRRPANALVDVRAITRAEFPVRILGLTVDNESAVRDQIEAALLQYFEQREPFIVGVSVSPRTDQISQTGVAGVVEDIVTTANGIFTSAQFTDPNGMTPVSFTLAEGQKALRGAVTYV